MLRCMWQIIHLHVNFGSAQECLKSLLTAQKLSLALHYEFVCLFVDLLVSNTEVLFLFLCFKLGGKACGSKIGKEIP